MKKVAAQLAVVVSLVLVTIGLTALPASANIPCPDNVVCTYRDGNESGDMYYYTYPGYDACITIGGSWNDSISSVNNTTGKYAIFHHDVGCNNTVLFRVKAGPNQKTNFVLTYIQDQASSFQWAPA